jgi:hypothetical protein
MRYGIRAVLQLLAGLLLGAATAAAGWRGAESWLTLTRPAALLSSLPRSPVAGPTLLFLFGPAECPSRLEQLDVLNRLDRTRVRVVGRLMVNPYDFPGWRDLVRAQRILFPVFPVSRTRVRLATAALGYTRTPLLLLFDSSNRLRYATDDPADPGLGPMLRALADSSTPAPAGLAGR